MARILFDLDDTLLASEGGYNEAYSQLNLDFSIFNTAKKHVKTSLPAGAVQSHNRWLYFKKYLELTKSYSPENLISLSTKYESKLLDYLSKDWSNKKGHDLLKKLKKKNSLAILTNENLRLQILKINLVDPQNEFFDFTITSEEVGVEKPNLRGFQMALENWNCSAEDVIMIGDSYENDILPAKSLGFKSIWINLKNSSDHHDQLVKISGFNELEKALESYL